MISTQYRHLSGSARMTLPDGMLLTDYRRFVDKRGCRFYMLELYTFGIPGIRVCGVRNFPASPSPLSHMAVAGFEFGVGVGALASVLCSRLWQVYMSHR